MLERVICDTGIRIVFKHFSELNILIIIQNQFWIHSGLRTVCYVTEIYGTICDMECKRANIWCWLTTLKQKHYCNYYTGKEIPGTLSHELLESVGSLQFLTSYMTGINFQIFQLWTSIVDTYR